MELIEKPLVDGFNKKNNSKKQRIKGLEKHYIKVNKQEEKKVLHYIMYKRKLNNPVTKWTIICNICEFIPELKNKSILTLHKWCYRFMEV